MAWTEEMVEGLRTMWKQGLTTNEIAKNLGVSKNSIVGKVHRLNLTARPSPIKRKEDETAGGETTEISAKPVSKPAKKITITPVEIKSANPAKNSSQNGVSLTELDNHTCRWPMGDPRDDNFCFCGKKVRSGQTYCEEHAAVAYVKPMKKG